MQGHEKSIGGKSSGLEFQIISVCDNCIVRFAERFYMATKRRKPIAVVDLFAGAGGLGEGFSAFADPTGKRYFENVASIEKDEFSHQTLLLRHFLHTFGSKGFPAEYYDFLDNKMTKDELFELYPENFKHAKNTALKILLGPDNRKSVKKILSNQIGKDNPWVLLGGPPCQAYSLVGRSRMKNDPKFQNDPRHFLYKEYLRTIADHRPSVFIMENVKGLLSSKAGNAKMIDLILDDLKNPSEATGIGKQLRYNLYGLSGDSLPGLAGSPSDFLVKCEKFGIPQGRHRVFIMGIRSDLEAIPTKLIHQEPPTLHQTIGNLPKIRSRVSRSEDTYSTWKKIISGIRKIMRKAGKGSAGLDKKLIAEIIGNIGKFPKSDPSGKSQRYPRPFQTNHQALTFIQDKKLKNLNGHEARSHMASDLVRYFFAANFGKINGYSPKLENFPMEILPDHQNVVGGVDGKKFLDRFRVQLKDRHASTVTSHISKDGHYFIHYDPIQSRSLTVREAARIQTFPDNYKFEGPRTSQYHQVGNAVPVFLSMQIAEIVFKVMEEAHGKS